MKIIKILPIGWCEGVTIAYNNIKKIANIHKKQNIYMVGWLVHNQHVVDGIKNMGITVLDDQKLDRLFLIKKIRNKRKAVVIFSAHGTNPKTIEWAKERFGNVYDLTCKYVSENIQKTQNKIDRNFNIIFFGNKKHPEAQAFKGLDKCVSVVEKKADLKFLSKKKEYYAITQTTTSEAENEQYRQMLLSTFTKPLFYNGSCSATKKRQQNLEYSLRLIDILVVVGDKRSNNTSKLLKIAKQHDVPAILVENSKDLHNHDFKKIKRCGLCSGASTPIWVVDEVCEELKNINK